MTGFLEQGYLPAEAPPVASDISFFTTTFNALEGDQSVLRAAFIHMDYSPLLGFKRALGIRYKGRYVVTMYSSAETHYTIVTRHAMAGSHDFIVWRNPL